MSEFKDHLRHVDGLELQFGSPTAALENKSIKYTFHGRDGKGDPCRLPLEESLFSKHLLLLGNIGTGKTNAISQLIAQIKNNMSDDDIMVIFDTKGDYFSNFYSTGDVVISNDTAGFTNEVNVWNIFAEINIDQTERTIRENALEIANNLFADKIKNTNQPFFPQAAKDIFATFLRLCALDENARDSNHNQALIEYLESVTRDELLAYFTANGENRICSYISKEASSQADGVLSELYQLLSEIFVGDFRNAGNLSIRELIRNKGGKSIFIEYDITIGSVLAPIYRLLFDLAIKEAMGKNRSKGNVWIVIDEFSLIPNLLHIDSGINFGRSQGLKFIIGAQNIPQIYKAYGEHGAESLLSGLSTTISFRIDDKKSRDFIQNRYGESLKKLIYKKAAQVAQGQIAEEIRKEKVVNDWDISNLKVGETIIGIPNMNPFIFRFEEFEPPV